MGEHIVRVTAEACEPRTYRSAFDFRAATSINVGAQPTSVVVADFNGDSLPDVVAANSGVPGGLVFASGNGDGTLNAASPLRGPDVTESVAAADFDHDGRTDLVTAGVNIGLNVGGVSADFVAVLLGNGNGTFRSPLD